MINPFRAIDNWFGRKVFVPPIVRFCQMAKCTQHRFANAALLIATLGIYPMVHLVGQLFLYCIYAVLVVIMLALNVFTPERPSPPNSFIRILLLFNCLYNSLLSVLITSAALYYGIAVPLIFYAGWLALICICVEQYARTITTIPPPEIKTVRKPVFG